MRLVSLFLLVLTGSVFAAESYPLWDGQEPVADYARKVNLPPTRTLDLGNGVNLELVLIPAGKFVMGTPEPAPVDEGGFLKKIITGQALLAVSVSVFITMMAFVIIRAIRQKRRIQLSLGRLSLLTLAAGGCVLSALHFRQAKTEYAAAIARFNNASHKEMPAHLVTLTQPFYMGKSPVTQAQYQQLMGTNPSQFKGNGNPVERVSWYDADGFCKKLSAQTKQEVRLPSEAEWEYSCRAGTKTTYYSGDTEADLARVAWYSANSNGTTHPIGQKDANVFGLYDMHGNVWQWCQDWYREDYYGMSAAENPKGPANGFERSLRGGSWGSNLMYCRSVYRSGGAANFVYFTNGFRVVLAPAFTAP